MNRVLLLHNYLFRNLEKRNSLRSSKDDKLTLFGKELSPSTGKVTSFARQGYSYALL
jgi:hypothetical protein